MMRKQTNTLLSALAFAFASATVSVPSMLVASDAVAQEQKASEKKTRRVPTLRGKVYEQLARAQTAADEAGNVEEAISILKEVEDKSLIEQAGEKIGDVAGYLDWIRNPIDKGVQSLLNWGQENLSLESVPDYMLDRDAAAAREKSLSEDPTWRDRVRDLLPSGPPSKRPLPSANVYGGENVVGTVQSPSTEIASLPVAPEEQEEQRDFGGSMLAALTASKPPQQNRNKQFIDYLYSTNNIFT